MAMKVSALDAALGAVWAMEEAALEGLLAIAAREHDVSPEALEGYRAKNLANAERAKVRDGVAILSAHGPLFKRANIMTAISGATSYDILLKDLNAALDDSRVRAIILDVDSPGGEASGTDELAAAVYAARGRKPIVAYVGGNGASAAYWLASAADRIVVSPTAILGSIGVQVAYRETAPRAGEKTYRFVSSQSPDKNPDLGTDAAAAQIQKTIDAMAQVFVETVARNRGVATETVLTDFGRGGIFVGQMAVDAGLADSIGTFESVLAELSAGKRKTSGRKGATMDEQTFTAAERDSAVTAAVTAERGRISGLVKLATAHNALPKLSAAIDGNTPVAEFALALADDAVAAAAAAPKQPEARAPEPKAPEANADRIAALQTDEQAASAAAASKGKEPEGETAESVAARIIAA